MTAPRSAKTKTPEEAREVILKLMEKRAPRPILIGEAALAIGRNWSLTAVEGLFFKLALDGRIRPATEAERRRYDLRFGWLLV